MTEDAPPLPLHDELTARERYALYAQGLLVLGSVPDLVVALVRLARRERGVQLGPVLASAALAAVAPPLGRFALRVQGLRGRAVLVGLVVAVPVLPLAAGATRATVIGRGHPLWQVAVSAAVRGVSACVTALPVVLAVARRRRDRLSSE